MPFIHRVFILLLCLFPTILASQSNAEDPNLQAGFAAHGSLKVFDSKAFFEKVVENDEASAKDRSTALRQLAIINWKYFNNREEAIKNLQYADTVGDYRSETWLVMARVELESKNFDAALEASQKALQLSASQSDKNYANYTYCKIILAKALHQVNARLSIDKPQLKEAQELLKTRLKENPTHTNSADKLLGISLLLHDGNTALEAWLSYFRLAYSESAYPYIRDAARILNTYLPKLDNPSVSKLDYKNIISGLAKSRFYIYARAFALSANNEELIGMEQVNHIITYAEYIDTIETLTNTYYRQVSIDKGHSETFLNHLETENTKLYGVLTRGDANAEDFSSSHFRNLINETFGSVFMVSSTSASRATGLVFGHVANERIRTIEQYGHSADFTFTELDMMVSNGYPSWFWEDRGAGGYALPNGFIRISTMYKGLAINAWDKVTDNVRRQKIETDIKNNLLEANSTADTKVVLTALSKKMELDALDELYTSLNSEGYTGVELQLKFIEQYEGLRDNATMFAHEGRHSIDRVVLENYRALGPKNIEYRGRLSQIAFSDAPKLELANMLNGVSSTPTGQSNQMIIDVYVDWMKAKTKQIQGYDTSKPLLTQLYKLSNSQLKDIIRSVDPLYLAMIAKN
ncbi:tetratricopeptide repeat protein [Winogradskyella sp. A3E31]|uniref:tetratricopeptide repeat protein n=1 Tax=Winogradskyella sp. A3E31 TaxID=3349637 RepID=UPI00398B40E9